MRGPGAGVPASGRTGRGDDAALPELEPDLQAWQANLAWERLLAGKRADVIITSDTPPLIDTLLYGRPGRRVIKNQVLGFCGIKSRKVVQFGSVKTAKPGKIASWIRRAESLGISAAEGPRRQSAASATARAGVS